MKKTLSIFIALALAVVGATAQNIAAPTDNVTDLADSLTVKRFVLTVGEFSKLVVEDSFDVDYKMNPDSAGIAVFETVPHIADYIIFSNNTNGRLTIEKPFLDQRQVKEKLPRITVYSNFLTEVKNAGDRTVRVLDMKPTANFQATMIGNGTIVVRNIDVDKFSGAIKTGNGTLAVTGRCTNAVLSNTGAGTIQADGLLADNASCRFFGTGTTGCCVKGNLTIKGTSGKLYLAGRPSTIKNYSMAVKIFDIETGETL